MSTWEEVAVGGGDDTAMSLSSLKRKHAVKAKAKPEYTDNTYTVKGLVSSWESMQSTHYNARAKLTW